jgi:hypothetical protein
MKKQIISLFAVSLLATNFAIRPIPGPVACKPMPPSEGVVCQGNVVQSMCMPIFRAPWLGLDEVSSALKGCQRLCCGVVVKDPKVEPVFPVLQSY